MKKNSRLRRARHRCRQLLFEGLEDRRLLTAGALDPTFHFDGIAQTDISGAPVNSDFQDVVIQPDGKFIAVGTADVRVGSTSRFTPRLALARFNSDGSPDNTFGRLGQTVTNIFPFGHSKDFAKSVALLADGSLLVAGHSDSGEGASDTGRKAVLAKYQADGSLDLTFADRGVVTTTLGADGEAASIMVQLDGKIVTVGAADGDGAVVRYNADGTLDNSFDTDGILTVDLGGADRFNDAAQQADGRIVVAGGNSTETFVLRLDANGELDTAFDGDGIVSINGGVITGDATAIALDNGDILVAAPAGGDVAVARISPNGALDATFDTDGVALADLGGADAVDDLAVQQDGKIVIGGASDGDMALARFNTNGSLDATFNVAGIAAFDVNGTDAARGIAIQSDGKVLAVGAAGNRSAVIRVDANGVLDATFGTAGSHVEIFRQSSTEFTVNDVATQADGKVVAVGGSRSTNFQSDSFMVAVRYNADGTLDSSFGTDGRVTLTVRASVQRIFVLADGKLLLGGSDGANLRIARLLPNGALDPTFGTAGSVTTDLGGSDFMDDLVLFPDGRFMAVGRGFFTGEVGLKLVRYLPDGALDATFGVGGIVETGEAIAGIARAALQTTGKLVVGSADIGISGDVTLRRFDVDGQLDPTFGTGGRVTTDVGQHGDMFSALTVDASDRILATATRYGGIVASDIAVLRYSADGQLDNTWANNGIALVDLDGEETASSIVVQPDGRVVVAGERKDLLDGKELAVLARLNTDGTHDTSFGVGGASLVDFGIYFRSVEGVALANDGKIVVAADLETGVIEEIAVARFDAAPLACPAEGCFQFAAFAHRVEEADGQIAVEVVRLGGSVGAADVEIKSRDVTAFAGDDYTAVATTLSFSAGETSKSLVVSVLPDSIDEGDEVLQLVLNDPTAGVAENPRVAEITIAGLPGDAGKLDATFGDGGLATADFGGDFDHINDMATQLDGKIVAVGDAGFGDIRDFLVARFNPDGSLDATFGAGGIVNTDIGLDLDEAFGVAVQNDGKIVVVGRAGYRKTPGGSGVSFTPAIVRYLPNGVLDRTFGNEGRVILDRTLGMTSAQNAVVLVDGSFAVSVETPNGIGLIRLHPNGSIDASFGIDGFALAAVDTSTSPTMGPYLLPNGGLILGGLRFDRDNNNDPDAPIVAQFHPDGSLDNSFGANGVAVFAKGDPHFALTRQEDGKLLFAGRHPTDDKVGVLRLLADGARDASFGESGLASADVKNEFQGDSFAQDIVVQEDGKVVVSVLGDFDDSGFDPERWVLVRFQSNGDLDTSFGINGVADARQAVDTFFHLSLRRLIIQDDNQFLLAGSTLTSDDERHFSIVRIQGDARPGNFEFSMGEFEVDENSVNATIIVRRLDGADGATTVDFATTNGAATATPDVDYDATSGTLTFNEGETLKQFQIPLRDDAQQEGPETVGLVLSNPTGGAALGAQSTATLTIFDGPGEIEFSLPIYNANENRGLAHINIQRVRGSDGAVSAVFSTSDGTATANADYQPVTRLIEFADGQMTASVAVAAFDDNEVEGRESVLLSLDNPIGASLGDRNDAVLNLFDLEPGRGTSPGSLDPTFGDNGFTQLTLTGGVGLRPHDMAQQADGKLVVVGELIDEVNTFRFTNFDFGVARFNADGSLDTNFGAAGFVRTDFGGDESARAVGVQPDGKIAVGGFSRINNSSDFALARYNSDGSLDASFGAAGIVLTDLGQTHDSAFGMLVEGSNIYLAGTTGDLSFRDFAVTRYLADGTLDPSFGGGGIVTTDFDNGVDAARTLAMDAGGKLVVGGDSTGRSALHTKPDHSADFALARYLPNGDLDVTFNGDGKATQNFRFGGTFASITDDDLLRKIIVQPDGKILAAGESDSDFIVARFNPDGSLDVNFGEQGSVDFRFVNSGDSTSHEDIAFDMGLQADGRIVLAGEAASRELGMARLTPDGSADLQFGAHGLVRVADVGAAKAVLIEPNGQIVTASRQTGNGDNGEYTETVALGRFLGASACPTQGCFQFQRVDFDQDENGGEAVIIVSRPPDAANGPASVDFATLGGTAIAGVDFTPVNGTLFFNDTVSTASFTVPIIDDAIFETFGRVDGFDESFLVTLSNPTGGAVLGAQTFAEVSIIDNDPNFVSAGRFQLSFSPRSVTEGSGSITLKVDRNSGTSGAVSVDFATIDGTATAGLDYTPVIGTLHFANGQDEQSIVVPINADTLIESDETFTLELSNPQGGAELRFGLSTITILDSDPLLCQNAGDLHQGFGTQGVALADLGSDEREEVNDAAILPDGKILVVGQSGVEDSFGIARFNPDGSLDASFGSGGIVNTDVRDGDGNQEEAFAVAPQNDGTFLVLGRTLVDADEDYVIARYLQDGALDTTFGTNGFVFHDLNLFESELPSVAVQPDGKIVAAGSAFLGDEDTEPFSATPSALALARFNVDGSLDPTFGVGGLVIADYGLSIDKFNLEPTASFEFFPTTQDTVTGVAIQNDGKIVIGVNDFDMMLARFDADGSVDTAFGDNGLLNLEPLFDTDDVFAFGTVGAVAVQSDGKILAAAGGSFDDTPTTFSDTQRGFLVARLNPDGSADTTFGEDGLAVANMGASTSAHAMTLQPDGRIIAAGTASGQFALTRLLPDGRPDIGFGANGRVLTDVNGSSQVRDVLMLNDGTVVAAGHTSSKFALAKYVGGTTPGGFRLRAGDYRVAENGGSLDIVVERVCGLDGDVSIDFATAVTGSAVDGVDFTGVSTTLNFPSFGALTQTVSIPILDDAVFEGDLVFDVNLSNPLGGAVLSGVANAEVTIADDEKPGLLQFAALSQNVDEDGGPLTVTIERIDGAGGAVSVEVTSTDGTATAGSDYTGISSFTVNFADGETSQTISLAPNDDVELEGNETLTLALGNPLGGAGLGFRPVSRVTIVDDELPQHGRFEFSAATFNTSEDDDAVDVTIRRVDGDMGETSVRYSMTPGSANSPLDFSAFSGLLGFNDGQTEFTISIPIADDDVADEGVETFTIQLTDPTGGAELGDTPTATVSIADNDLVAPPGLSIGDATVIEGDQGEVLANFEVTLSSASNETITVGFATQNGTAQAGTDFTSISGELTFAPQVVSQTATVRVQGDTEFEADETFTVRLIGPTGNVTLVDFVGLGTITNDDADADAFPWHNERDPFDVNNDTFVNLVDAFILIDELRARGIGAALPPEGPPGPNGPFIDLNKNNKIDLIDAHSIIAKMRELFSSFNAGGEGSPRSDVAFLGEGEHSADQPAVQAVLLDKLVSESGVAGNFGFDVDVDGETMVVGDQGANTAGAAFVFVRNGDVWEQQAKLQAPTPKNGDRFGFGVAVDGDRIVVAKKGAGSGDEGDQFGAAYIYERTADVWNLVTELTISDATALPLVPDPITPFILQERFIARADIQGDRVIIGGSRRIIDNPGPNDITSVMVNVFEFDGANWVSTAKLTSPGNGESSTSKYNLQLDGDTIVTSQVSEQAAIVFFRGPGGAWVEQAKLVSNDFERLDDFAAAVSINGDVLIAGAERHDIAGAGNNAGAAYVFQRNNGVWSQTAKLTAPIPVGAEEYGADVSIDGDTIAVGSTFGTDGAGDAGAVYLYHKNNGGVWSLAQTVVAPDLISPRRFGSAVSLEGDRMAVGAYFEDSAYVYEVTDPIDFGDAPDSYSTRPLSGASHLITDGPILGTIGPDGEDPSSGLTQLDQSDRGLNASSDDARGVDDEDGVSIGNNFVIERNRTAVARVTITGGLGNARLYGYIDLNDDGDFDDANEQIVDGSVVLADGDHEFPFDVPADTPLGNTYSRFRVSTNQGLSFDGRASDGEVEDNRICVVDPGQKASVCQISDANTAAADSDEPAVSADGRFVAFHSTANATGENIDQSSEIFVYDIAGGSLKQITHSRSRASRSPSINADGSRIAFVSFGDFTGENSDLGPELFIFDAGASTYIQLTNINGFAELSDPTISADGTKVSFLSNFDPLGTNANGNIELFLFDTSISTLSQLTVIDASLDVLAQQISGDGNHVVFGVSADLTGSNSDGNQEVFVASSGVIRQLTETAATFNGNPSIDHDGDRIVFESTSSFPNAPNVEQNLEIVLYDATADAFTPVTSTTSRSADSPSIRADGERIAFESDSDLAGTGNTVNQVFVFEVSDQSIFQTTQIASFRSSIGPVSGGSVVAFSLDRDLTGENSSDTNEIFLAHIAEETFPWHNERDPFDVNNDTFVNLVDAFILIDELRNRGIGAALPPEGPPGPDGPFVDLNRNNRLDLLDAHSIVAKMRELFGAFSEGEGESFWLDQLAPWDDGRDDVFARMQRWLD